MSDLDLVVVELLKPGIALITINRPQALNALNSKVLLALGQKVIELESNLDVKAVVITGSGQKAFVAGADISEMISLDSSQAVRLSQLGNEVMNRLSNMRVPVIAAVNGFALGGGCELALACDYIIAKEGAIFGLPEVGLGVIPGFGGTFRLQQRVGLAKAKELIFTGRRISADEALKIGLVNSVEKPEVFESAWLSHVQEIVGNSSYAVTAAKTLLNDVQNHHGSVRMDAESMTFGEAFAFKDRAEGMKAFTEKRKPSFNKTS